MRQKTRASDTLEDAEKSRVAYTLVFPLTNKARTCSDTAILANIARLSSAKWYTFGSHASIIGDSFQFLP